MNFKTNLLTLGLMIFCLGNSLFAQVFNLDISKNIIDGPYLEVTDDGFNVYQWTNSSGYLSDKVGNERTKGEKLVNVEILRMNSHDNAGELFRKAAFATRLDSELTSRSGEYFVYADKAGTSQEPFAQNSDPNKDELMSEFPSSDHHSGNGAAAQKAQLERIGELSGKGLLGLKKPYTLSFSDRNAGRLVSNSTHKVELSNLPVDDSKADWKATGGSIVLSADEPEVYPALYSKRVKKDRFSPYMNYKLVSYDKTGKIMGEKNLSFEKPHEMRGSFDVIGAEGKRKGMIYTFEQLYGVGWKKANPSPDKTLMHFVQLDENFKVIAEFDYDFVGESTSNRTPNILSCFQSDDGIKVNAVVVGSKKSGIETGIYQYTISNGKMSMDKVSKLSDITASTPNSKPIFLGDFGKNQHQLILNNGDFMLFGREKNMGNGESPTTYGPITYLRTTADGSIKAMGVIGRGTSRSEKDPSLSFENLKDNRAFIRIGNYDGSVYYWVYSVADGTFKQITPPASFQTEATIRRGDYVYYIGKEAAESSQWQVLKIKI